MVGPRHTVAAPVVFPCSGPSGRPPRPRGCRQPGVFERGDADVRVGGGGDRDRRLGSAAARDRGGPDTLLGVVRRGEVEDLRVGVTGGIGDALGRRVDVLQTPTSTTIRLPTVMVAVGVTAMVVAAPRAETCCTNVGGRRSLGVTALEGVDAAPSLMALVAVTANV